MVPVVASASFVLAVLLYGGASALFFLDIARLRSNEAVPRTKSRFAPLLLGVAALGHGVYVSIASFVAGVCPIYSVHFLLSVASLMATGVYLVVRRHIRIEPLGLLVSPLGLAFLLGTYFLGKPGPVPKLDPAFVAMHVLANLLGVALFLLAGGAAALYLFQEKRLKQKKRGKRFANLPPLDALDRAVHWFLVAGFPLLTLGIVTGTIWARQLETGTTDEVLRIVLGYATWILFAGVLLLRAAAGWRGRRAAYGTIAGLSCALAVLVIYLVRPAAEGIGFGG